jgi:phage shock protein C
MRRGRKLYLDKENAKIAGVCAGIADYLEWDLKIVRIIWVIATIMWSPVMITAYVVMAWLVDPKPGPGFATASPSSPWPTDPAAPRRRLVDVQDRFSRLDRRLQALESVVTSRAFQIDRELRA